MCNASTSCFTTTWNKNLIIRIYVEIIFLHISNGSEILLIFILKLFVDTLVSSLNMEAIIISL